jgi:hypothetical protein
MLRARAVVALDGTKMVAKESSNADYQRIALEILKEAERKLEQERERRHGERRADEQPLPGREPVAPARHESQGALFS